MQVGDVRAVAVIGTGLMGSQIAEILSRVGGYKVFAVDKDEKLVEKGIYFPDT